MVKERLQAALVSSYRIGRELGGGGMSRVFVVTELTLDRPVVLKVLPPELVQAVSTERFRQEIRLAARLQHPHIVALLAAGDAEGLLYYTMPFIEGESLGVRLAREGELPVRDAVRVLRDIAGGSAGRTFHRVAGDDRAQAALAARRAGAAGDAVPGEASSRPAAGGGRGAAGTRGTRDAKRRDRANARAAHKPGGRHDLVAARRSRAAAVCGRGARGPRAIVGRGCVSEPGGVRVPREEYP
jgi:hypothetical protein